MRSTERYRRRRPPGLLTTDFNSSARQLVAAVANLAGNDESRSHVDRDRAVFDDVRF
jgi:hypothetical protein